MSEAEKIASGEEGNRKRTKVSEDRNSEEAHTFGEGAPKLTELGVNGGSTTDHADQDSAMAVDESKTSSKPNGTEGSEGDKEEGKQDLKSIEDEFTQLKEKFFSDKIAAVKAEIEQIEIGTHEGIKSETANLESKKSRRIQLAHQIHRYQINSIDASLRADLKCADDDFISEAKELKDKTLKTLNKKKKELEEEKRDFSLADPADAQRASTRTLRKRGQAKDAASEAATPAPVSTSTEGPKKVPELKVRLTDEEMDADMAQIQRGLINM